ncbi:phosphatidylethanolamine-binding protein [Schizophyllum fasciatum]
MAALLLLLLRAALLSCLAVAPALARGTHRLFDIHSGGPLSAADFPGRADLATSRHRDPAPFNTAAILGLVRAANVTTDSVREAFYAAKIVPDVLPAFDPALLVGVNFTNPELANSSVLVEPGAVLTRDQTKFLPSFFISNHTAEDAAQTYIVVQVDPDAHTPQNPDVAQVRHLLAGNFTADGDVAGDPLLLANSSAAISEWRRPSPPAGSDPHRYVILLYPQPANFTASSVAHLVNASSSATLFNINDFAEATGLGLPVAGTYFLTGPDAESE